MISLAVLLAAAQTVCTITVNSPDERDVLRRSLPEDRYRFVELVEHGRRDWLASACRQKVSCDVLVVSGHFAGVEFYSSKPANNETLKVDEIQRAMCSESCPDVFANLKEVYLFGCDTLKSEAVRSATPEVIRGLVREGQSRPEAERIARELSSRYAESSRDLMRRLFANVPVIYGFSSLAPLGRHAGPMLQRHLDVNGLGAFGTGRVDAKLAALFAPSSMVVTSGQSEAEPYANERQAACRFYDERRGDGARIDAMHEVLAGSTLDLRMSFDRVERFFAAAPADAGAMTRIAGDAAAATRYLELARDTQDPALRLRMIALARTLGWLDADSERQERVLLVRDVITDRAMDYGEVDLVCGLNGDGALDPALRTIGRVPAMTAPQAAALACLGDTAARGHVLRAFASPEEREARAVQAYLRHRPIDDASQLRALAAEIARMPSPAAQTRALYTLGRLHVTDRDTLDELLRLFTRTRSFEVQLAIAEVFLRAGPEAIDSVGARQRFRLHRLRASGGQPDLIEQVSR